MTWEQSIENKFSLALACVHVSKSAQAGWLAVVGEAAPSPSRLGNGRFWVTGSQAEACAARALLAKAGLGAPRRLRACPTVNGQSPVTG